MNRASLPLILANAFIALSLAPLVVAFLHPSLQLSSRLCMWSVVLVPISVLVRFGIGIWLEVRSTEAAGQELQEHAEYLRQERAQRFAARAGELEAALRRGEQPAPTKPEAAGASVVVPLSAMAVARAARDGGTCPFCQTRIVAGEEYLTCPSCKTPYHADCWEYNNGCAVYGCNVRIKT